MATDDLHIPEDVTQITDRLKAAGFEIYLVGGCVRDLLRGKTPKDWDAATDATPEEMLQIFDHAHNENDFGTVQVVTESDDPALKTVEITTFRTESAYSDGRRPDSVTYTKNLNEDLKRRDFTVNALALDMTHVSRDNKITVSPETLIDNHGGMVDLQKKRLQAIGAPQDRFQEDALRILRAIRFSAQIDLEIEKDTLTSMKSLSDRVNDIAVERIKDEFEKIILSDKPKKGLKIAQAVGVLKIFLPELTQTIDIEQNQAHDFDLWTHLVNACQTAADKDWPLHIRLAALFHDIGKYDTRSFDQKQNDWTFYNHEVVGARMTEEILSRLTFANQLVSRVTNLVRWHMFYSDTDEITHSAVRRLVKNVGKDNVWDLIKLRRCDRLGMGRPKEEPYRLRKYQSMIEEVIRDPVTVKKLAINGDDVIRETDETPGPRIGWILHALLEDVLDDPEINQKDTLIQKAKTLANLNDTKLKKRGEAGKKTKEKKEKKAVNDIRDKYWVD